jgi:hypothetical protein
MHHFLYPTQDAYISNKSSLKNKNFGLDELLAVGVDHNYSNVLNTTKVYHYAHEFVSGLSFENFTGVCTGSFFGIIHNSNGTIIGDSTRFTSSYFSGSLTGSINGTETGSSFVSTNFSGSLVGYSGNIQSNIIYGNVSGSITADCFSTFTGVISSSVGSGSGVLTGDETKAQLNYTLVDRKYIDRSLIKFDLSFISSSIVSGDITNPKFYLKLKSTQPTELSTEFKIYVFPVSQSWDQGNGFLYGDGSDAGVSWNWRDSYSGSSWFSPHTETIITSSIDYINDYSHVNESFMRGGSTWYNIPCSQSFSYQVSDIDMDVTNIVNAWLTQTIPNEGLVLLYSGETNISASTAYMYFYSKETNTIYSPKLDIGWDDSIWITGSFGTGSVVTTQYSPKLSGSMVSPVTITELSASGNFNGNAFLVIGSGDVIDTGSVVNLTGNSATINGLNINGSILGTSIVDVSGIRYITASFSSGDFLGCHVCGQYSSSMISGFLSGSFNEQLFLGWNIIGNIPNNHSSVYTLDQYSPVSGSLLGNISSSSTLNGGIFKGVATTGLLKGASLSIPFTGSYSYVTSSVSVTSSVEITGSSLQPLDTEKPFVVIIQNLKKEYSFGDFPRIGVFGREHFPLKTFGKAPQQPTYITPKFLPSSSYYSIKDNETEEIIVGFDNYTKISCDSSGNYFYLDTTSLVQERYYKILIKVVADNKNIYTFDAFDLFKVRR